MAKGQTIQRLGDVQEEGEAWNSLCAPPEGRTGRTHDWPAVGTHLACVSMLTWWDSRSGVSTPFMELDGLGSRVESDLAAVGGTLDESGSVWFLLEGRKSEFVLVPKLKS